MIIGFDVCHDSQNKNKSYGALVATMNDAHTSYFSCVEPHESGEELSNHLAAGISSKFIFCVITKIELLSVLYFGYCHFVINFSSYKF